VVPSSLPIGESAPDDGRLPESALAQVASQPFGAYVHVPFCVTRCGYCDFNTYTADELRGTSTSDYVVAALAEIGLAREVLPDAPPLNTVFFGGGTPTLLPAAEQLRLLTKLVSSFGIASDAEVTTEANPESVDANSLLALRQGGVNRLSMGMQSAVPHVLKTLDRAHTPGRVTEAVAAARKAGFDNVSLDLIYGAPGETVDDWRRSLEAAIELQPEHISAYALIVEDGTRLARQIRSGELIGPDDDLQAAKYELADELLTGAGFEWYEVSNWSRGDGNRSRHNLGYWEGSNWWGIGPGAHSHVGGVRWWNVKHPRAYGERLASGLSPAAGRELLDEPMQALEQVMLQLRVREGLSRGQLSAVADQAGEVFVADGLLEPGQWIAGRAVLTGRGRLLADLVVRELTA